MIGTDRASGQLADRLLELFLAEGFRHFGVADLAERLRCSKTTLYAVAPSKEQLFTTVVRRFFRQATDNVERAVVGAPDPLDAYLSAIATELAPASPAFIRDVESFAPTDEIYRHNTEAAAQNVSRLLGAATPPPDAETTRFRAYVAATVMRAIQRGELVRAAGLDDAAAYRQLRALLTTPG